MRYIADDNGYLQQVSFGAMIECNGLGCTEYTGDVPARYDSLADWFTQEGDKLHRWHIVEGQLTLDEDAPEPEAYAPPKPEPVTSMRKLWENPARTAEFGETNVSLDLVGYDEVLVYFCLNTSNRNKFIVEGRCPVGETLLGHFTWADSGISFHRAAATSARGVEFYPGYYYGSQDNKACIPYRIYGIKGVTDRTVRGSAICGEFLCGEAVCGT